MNEDKFTRAQLMSKRVCASVNEVTGHGKGGKGLEKDGAKHRCFVMTSKVSELMQTLTNSADLSE